MLRPRGRGCVWVTPTMRTAGVGWLNVLPASANAPRDIARARAMPPKPYATIFVFRPMGGNLVTCGLRLG